MDSKLKGWHSRGYLPHFDGGILWQFITIHLADSVPQQLIEKWKKELEGEPDEIRKIELYERVEKYLDRGYGACYLKREDIAAIIRDSLLHFDGQRHKLTSWVVMPNHVHFLLLPLNENSLSDIVHSIKSYTATKVNKALERTGQFWQEDYFDRFIRTEEHYYYTTNYIHNNPVKAGLCKAAKDWKFSSINMERPQSLSKAN